MMVLWHGGAAEIGIGAQCYDREGQDGNKKKKNKIKIKGIGDNCQIVSFAKL